MIYLTFVGGKKCINQISDYYPRKEIRKYHHRLNEALKPDAVYLCKKNRKKYRYAYPENDEEKVIKQRVSNDSGHIR